jgi:hypothetical protein
VECLVEAEYDKDMNTILPFDCKCRGSRKENTDDCCIKHLSPDLQTKGKHGIREREGEISDDSYGIAHGQCEDR